MSGVHEGRRFILDRPRNRIGRNDSLEVYLGADPRITPHHATINRDGGGFLLLSESGAVTVNGAAVTRYLLQDRDEILVGQTRLRFRSSGGSGKGGRDH
jgi:pSer/pThr/pTyr-binding forkhead associated (FHA) protein